MARPFVRAYPQIMYLCRHKTYKYEKTPAPAAVLWFINGWIHTKRTTFIP